MNETVPDQFNEEKEESRYISREELKTRIAEIHEKLHELFTSDSNHSNSLSEIVEKQTKLLDDFVFDLWGETKKFLHVFSTESGSVYFLLQDGGCFRIKNNLDERHIEPITNHIFFIDDETADVVLASEQKELLKQDISIQDYKLGVRPFEFEIEGFPKIEYDIVEKDGNTFLNLKGDKYGNNASGIHVGHRITNSAI